MVWDGVPAGMHDVLGLIRLEEPFAWVFVLVRARCGFGVAL